jgi:hypothetical protein
MLLPPDQQKGYEVAIPIKEDVQMQLDSKKEIEPPCNEVHARVGRWQADLRWLPYNKIKEEEPHRGVPIRFLALALMVFFVIAIGATWELVPYVESIHVAGELARLELGGPICLVGGVVLLLVRKIFFR